MGREGVEPPTP